LNKPIILKYFPLDMFNFGFFGILSKTNFPSFVFKLKNGLKLKKTDECKIPFYKV